MLNLVTGPNYETILAIKCKRIVGDKLGRDIKGRQLREKVGEKFGEKVGKKTGEKVEENLGEIHKLNLCPCYRPAAHWEDLAYKFQCP